MYHTVPRPESSFNSRSTCGPPNLRPFSTSGDNTLEFYRGKWYCT